MYTAILDNVARHVTLTADEAACFTALLTLKRVLRHQTLLVAGQRARELVFVIQGCIRTYTTDSQGKEHNLEFATESWWSGDLNSLFVGGPATLSLQALEDSDVLTLRVDQLESLFEQVPALERFFRILFQNACVLYQRRFTATQVFTAEMRYTRFDQQYPRLFQRISQKHIASYLGVTPEFLSMLRKKQARRGRS